MPVLTTAPKLAVAVDLVMFCTVICAHQASSMAQMYIPLEEKEEEKNAFVAFRSRKSFTVFCAHVYVS